MKRIGTYEIESLAQKFRVERLEVNATEPIHVKAAIRKLNIMAVYRPLSDASCGLSVKTKNGKSRFMLINSNMTRGRQHFTIAHEFFHLFYDEHPVLHLCDGKMGRKDVSEANADAFASALLMPKEGILKRLSPEEIVTKRLSLAKVIRIEQYYGVSRSSLLYRLKALKIISDTAFEALKAVPVKESVRQLGVDQALYEKGNELLVISDFGEKAKRLLDEDKISEGHYNALINMISNDKN